MSNNTLWYIPLEPLKSRYTEQLCKEWILPTFDALAPTYGYDVHTIWGDAGDRIDIKVGAVLDAVGRSLYSFSQWSIFLKHIETGQVRSGDIVYLQDFWTPGVESVFYALDLYGIKNVRFYAMCHAQSVDEFDFTYDMLPWISDFEKGIARKMDMIFVASTIHYKQIKKAGWPCRVSVVNLPFNYEAVRSRATEPDQKKKIVSFSSRMDWEKNPMFMLGVASEFLFAHLDWEWHVTTSGAAFRSNDPDVVPALEMFVKQQPRFKMISNITKLEYWQHLADSAILFNSSKQDYVSWTLLEGSAFGCDLVYPAFRSFPECVPQDRLYAPFDTREALEVLDKCVRYPIKHYGIAEFADYGRNKMAELMFTDDNTSEFNIWL